MIAAQHGQTAIVNELLAQGADVNAEDLVIFIFNDDALFLFVMAY